MVDPRTPTFSMAAPTRLTDPRAWDAAGVEDRGTAELWYRFGFDPETAAGWVAAARYVLEVDGEPVDWAALPALATVWKVADFLPDDVRRWRDALVDVESGLDLAHEARRWRAAGFDSERAGLWNRSALGGQHPLELAVALERAEWHPFHAMIFSLLLSRHPRDEHDERIRAWLSLGLPAEQTLDYAKAGVSTEDASALEAVALQPDVLARELQARFELLPPLDAFQAMHLNHHAYLAFGPDDAEDQWPFYARHIRDLHDE